MKKTILILAAIALVSSCVKEVSEESTAEIPNPDLKEMSFTVSFDNATRTVLNEDRSVSFVPGDKISVFANGTNYEFTTEEGGAQVIFTGFSEEADTYYAIYPYSATATISEGVIRNVNIDPDSSITGTGTFSSKKAVAVGMSTDKNFVFKQVTALLKITVPTDVTDLKEVIVFNRDDASSNTAGALTGTFDITLSESGNPSVSITEPKFQTGFVGPDGGGKPVPPGDYYLPVLPAQLSVKQGIDLTLLFMDEFVGRAFNGNALKLERTKVYNLGTVKRSDEFVFDSFESGAPISADDYIGNTNALSIVENPVVSGHNGSHYVLKDDMSGSTSSTSGYLQVKTTSDNGYIKFPSTMRDRYNRFRVKLYLGTNAYYPRARRIGNPTVRPALLNGVSVKSQADWDAVVRTDDWNELEWDISQLVSNWTDLTEIQTIEFRFFVDWDGSNVSGYDETTNNRLIYIDDIAFVLAPQQTFIDPLKVDCKNTVTTGTWSTYDAYTVDRIQGFTPKPDPATDEYGGWTIMNLGNPDGYFRVQEAAGRWWLVDPLGNIFLSKGVAVFSPGSSARQKENIQAKFGDKTNWAITESQFLKEEGFNSLGAWSEVDIVKDIPEPMPYTVILRPMNIYIKELKSSSDATLKAAFKAAGWEGYPYDFAMVFDERFDEIVESTLSQASAYRNDKYLMGYFIDNEIPWKDYALEYCLTKWPSTHINHQKAQEWLDQRKGKAGCTISDATSADKQAFIAYCYEIYLQKVTAALKKYDPNHLFLGDRFNQWNYELVNPEMFRVAGKYVDVVSINHYRRWEPDAEAMRNWEAWSGKPFMVTEFYTKGLDSGLGNTTGAGWVVKTQTDRGLFYQNFVNQLLKSKVCVGWHWFTYMDNDPTNTGADSSNIDSNKGIVQWDCTRYDDCIDQMRTINECIYNLASFYTR